MDKTIKYYSYWVSKRTNYEVEDVYQDLSLHLFLMYKKYDGLKYMISTFLTTVIKNRSITITRKFYNDKSVTGDRAVYMNDDLLLKYNSTDNVTNDISSREYFNFESSIVIKYVKSKIEDKTSKKVLDVFELLVRGYSVRNISTKLNISKSWCYRIIKYKLNNLIKKNVDIKDKMNKYLKNNSHSVTYSY